MSDERAASVHRWPLRLLHLLCHAVVWAVVLVPTWVQTQQGQRPSWDDAVIALRSYAVLTAHSPLLGQASTVTPHGGHQIFDLGPLEYWLLTVPVHLDRATGAEFGAAVIVGIALSLALEALWSALGPWAALLGAAAVANLAWQLPFVLQDLTWNPNVGLLFLLATFGLSIAVAAGRLAWWPVAVATGSVAMQCHSFYAITAVLVVASSLLLCWTVARTRRWRPLVVGAVMGLVCWSAPLVQQLTGRPGNLTLLASSGQSRQAVGFSQAFEMLGVVGALKPLWLTAYPRTFVAFLPITFDHDPVVATLVVLVPVAVAVVGVWRRRAGLAAVASVTVGALVGYSATVALMPTSNLLNLVYLLSVLWVTSVLWWVTLVWAVVSLLRSRLPAVAPGLRLWWLPSLAGLALVVLTVVGLRWVGTAHVVNQEDPWRTSLPKVNAAARAIEQRYPHRPVLVMQTNIDPYGLAWRLFTDGQVIGIGAPNGRVLGVAGRYAPDWPLVDVDVVDGRVALRPHPQS